MNISLLIEENNSTLSTMVQGQMKGIALNDVIRIDVSEDCCHIYECVCEHNICIYFRDESICKKFFVDLPDLKPFISKLTSETIIHMNQIQKLSMKQKEKKIKKGLLERLFDCLLP